MIPSESRRPGMTRQRRCECGEALGVNDGERCAACQPQLSDEAFTAALRAERYRTDMAAIDGALAILTRLERAIRKVMNAG